MKLKPGLSRTNVSSGDDESSEYYVLGDGPVASAVARRLRAAGRAVTLVDEFDPPTRDSGGRSAPGAVQELKDTGLSEASTVIVAMPRDSQNLLVAQLVRAHFDIPEVVVLVNTPERCDLFADVGHEPVCATSAMTDALVTSLEATESDLDQTA